MSDFIQGDNFVLAFTTNLTAVRFWDMELSAADYSGSIFWEIRNNAASVPGGTVLGTGTATPTRTAAGSALGLNIFQNDFAITVNNVAAGTYWLVLHNGPLASTTFSDYYWAWTAVGGANAATDRGVEKSLNPLAVNWSTNGQEHAFLISGDAVGIPEPGTLVFISTGIAAMGWARRQSREGRKS
ncbi:MAG: PEP-CTERM sorting domain-containing protein [Bryobacterales bacterium]|nr:PEP-CTERM sorting domain-containing protein [Bryobacterales bacterium]